MDQRVAKLTRVFGNLGIAEKLVAAGLALPREIRKATKANIRRILGSADADIVFAKQGR